MRLHNLTLRNFRRHADSTIAFGDGLTGIIGPNGAGKSTILEAVAWALYGADAIRGTKDTIRWHGAPERHKAEVTLRFGIGSMAYQVWRSESSATLTEIGWNTETPLAVNTTAVNAAVRDLLGLGWREFQSTYLCGQKDLLRLSAMRPEERKTFMREVMGIGRLDAAVRACRVAKNEARAKRDGAAQGLGEREMYVNEWSAAYTGESAADEALLHARTAKNAAFTQERTEEGKLARSAERYAQHDRLTRTRDDAERDAQTAQREIDRLTVELAAAEEAAARVAERGPEVEEALGVARGRVADLMVAKAAAGEREQLLARLDEADGARAAALADREEGERLVAAYDTALHQADEVDLREFEGGHEAMRDHRISRRADLLTSAAMWDAQAADFTDSAADLERLGAEGTCPTCRQVMGESTRAVVEHYRAEAVRLASEAQAARDEAATLAAPTQAEKEEAARVVALREKVDHHRRAQSEGERGARVAARAEASVRAHDATLETLRARVADLPAGGAPPPASITEAQGEVQKLERALDALADDRVRAGKVEALRAHLNIACDNATEAQMQAAHAADQIAALAFDPAAHDALQQAAENARRAREEAATALARAEEALRAAEARRDRAERALADYDQRAASVAALAESCRLRELADERLAALRTAQVAGIRPEMEELVSGFVSTLTDGLYESARVDDDFGVTLYSSGVPCPVISGGEEDVVAIALRLAVSLMIAERAGHHLGCLILDEPFGSQDEGRRRNILDLVTARLSSLFEQVLVISHFPELQHRCANAVQVDRDEVRGCSVVRNLNTAGV